MLALLLVAAGPVAAERYGFRVYERPDGLGDLVVKDLLQDRTGSIWAATENGLYRYEGLHFTRFSVPDGIPSEWTTRIAETSEGTLWVATAKGLARRRGDRFEAFPLNNEYWPNPVETDIPLDVDEEGNLFVGTGKGLLIVSQRPDEPAPRSRLVSLPALASTHVTSVCVTTAGRVIVGCGAEIWEIDRDWVPIRRVGRRLPKDRWVAIFEDRSGALWIGGFDRHLMRMPRDGVDFEPAGAEYLGRGEILQDRDGAILVPSTSGLSIFRDTRWTSVDASNGLPGSLVLCPFQDRSGTMWLGLESGGLARWLGYGQWTAWTTLDGLPGDFVTAIARDNLGNLWVATTQGVAMQKPGETAWHPWTPPGQDVGKYMVFSLLATPDGKLWIAVFKRGLYSVEVETGRVTGYGPKQGLDAPDRVHLMLDRQGAIWTSGFGGLYRGLPTPRGVRFEQILPSGGNFFQTALDRQGRVWAVGTKGVAIWQDGSVRQLTKRDGLKEDFVFVVGQGAGGSMWIGYRMPRGLSQVSGPIEAPRIEDVEGTPDLASLKVFSIRTDSRGWTWVGTEAGLDLYRSDGTRRHYARPDGLIWDDCNFAAFWEDPDGSVWIGTSKGLSRFRPGNAEFVPPPQVHILAVETPSGAVSPADRLMLESGTNSFSLRLATFDFVHESTTRFRYRLIGADDSWHETPNREIQFPSLRTGRKYLFEVVASRGDGEWGAVPARLHVEVLPNWYERWWFAAFGVCAAAFAVYAGHLFRLREVQRRERVLAARVEAAIRDIRVLRGLLPVCAWCKRVRSDDGYWQQIEVYIRDHSEADFTHGICPKCAERLMAERPPPDGSRVRTP